MAINLSLSKIPWYGQVGLFVAIGLASAAAFWNFYAQPAQASIDQRRAQLAAVRAEIAKGLATAKQLPQFRREVAEQQARLERLKMQLPEEKDVADLLRRIQGMATQSSLTIRSFTPRAVATRQLHAEWPIGLELEGTYHNLGAFLERVSKFPRIINVSGLKITAKDRSSSGVTIAAECTATTFVLIENASQKPAAPAAPGAKAD
jgi:type IV pilus assembly protein PilO